MSELAEWDVLFASVGPREGALDRRVPGCHDSVPAEDGGESEAMHGKLLVSDRQRVSTRGIERTGLSTEQRAAAEEAYRSSLGKEGRLTEGRPLNYPDWAYRAERARPLLVIHLLDIRTDAGERATSEPVVAWSISFPKTSREEKRVEFVVNTTWLREHYGDDLEEEEMLGDDD